MVTRKKHILVVSDPPAAPGYLPRLRYMCDYLVKHGFRVTLLTEAYQPIVFEHSYPVMEILMYSGGMSDWAFKTAWTLISDWHNRVFAQRALTALEGKRFDIVLCTAFSDFPLGAAQRIAARYRIPLICDIRDLDEQVDDSHYQYRHLSWWTRPFRRIYRSIHIRRRNKVLRAADAVTTVSLWHVDFIKRLNPETYLVYNGYDEAQFYPDNVRTDVFRLTYIGSLFEWQQQALEKVRAVIGAMNAETPRYRIELDIHTPQNDPVPHTQLGDTIRRSSVMLVLTNPATHGMLTTKFYEAFGCAKPVLCVPSDNGALAELIRYTNAGIATDDEKKIKQFLALRYNEWKRQGFTRQDCMLRELFSRAQQTLVLEEIIRKVLQK